MRKLRVYHRTSFCKNQFKDGQLHFLGCSEQRTATFYWLHIGFKLAPFPFPLFTKEIIAFWKWKIVCFAKDILFLFMVNVWRLGMFGRVTVSGSMLLSSMSSSKPPNTAKPSSDLRNNNKIREIYVGTLVFNFQEFLISKRTGVKRNFFLCQTEQNIETNTTSSIPSNICICFLFPLNFLIAQ